VERCALHVAISPAMLWSSDDASLRELGLRWKKNAKKAAKLKREPKFAGKKVRLPFVLVFLCRSTLDSLLTHLPPPHGFVSFRSFPKSLLSLCHSRQRFNC